MQAAVAFAQAPWASPTSQTLHPPRVSCATAAGGSASWQPVRAASATAAAAAALAAGHCRRQQRTGASSRTARRAAAVAEAPATVDAGLAKLYRSMFSDVLGLKVPPKLEVFLALLQSSGYKLLAKGEWKECGDIHPFLMPIATRGEGDDLETIGLLVRGVQGGKIPPEEFLVVSQKAKKTLRVKYVAPDMEKYIARRAEELNFEQEEKDTGVLEMVKDAYDMQFTGQDRNALNKWLLLKIGAFPDVYEQLKQEHIENGDYKSALVISDAVRDAFGTSWSFPHSDMCKMLRRYFDGEKVGDDINREEEADHSAVRCFKTGYPLWTLAEDDDLADLLLEAKMPKMKDINDARVFFLGRVVDDQRAAVRTGELSLGCAALAKAQALMDAVNCGHKSYKAVRAELRDLYSEIPGCEPVEDMISYYMD